MLWQKVEEIKAKLEESVTNTRQEQKLAKKVLESLNSRWWHPTAGLGAQSHEVRNLLERMRQKEVEQIEPLDFWQDLDYAGANDKQNLLQ